MPVDPTDPDTFDDNGDNETDDAAETDVETPEADAAEQHTDLAPRRDASPPGSDPDSADEGDRAEQARVVELNEDEYR